MRCAARRTWRLGSSLQRKTCRKSRRKRVLGIPQRHLEKLTVTFRFFHDGATFVTTCGLFPFHYSKWKTLHLFHSLLGPYCLKHCFLPPETAAAAAGVLASAECEVPLHEQAKVHRARLQQCEAPPVNKECWPFRNYSHPGYFSFVYCVHYIDRDSSLSFSTAKQYKRLFGML